MATVTTDAARGDPPARILSAAHVLALVASVLIGAGAALLVVPTIFAAIPSDTSRIGFLIRELRENPEPPEIVGFGSSIVMSGFDAGQLQAEIPGNLRSWNIASTGQTLAESYLLTQELPETVQLAIYGFELRPARDVNPLVEQKYNAFYMYGLRPAEDVIDALSEIYPKASPVLHTSDLRQRFNARWAIRQFADTQMRRTLRRDLSLASADLDLHHPQRYSAPVAPAVLERGIARRRGLYEEYGRSAPARDLALAKRIALEARAKGRATLFVTLPVHPDLFAPDPEGFRVGVAEVGQALGSLEGTTVLDASELLAAESFIDHIHPTDAGAAVLTQRIARSVAERL